MTTEVNSAGILLLADIDIAPLRSLLSYYQLHLHLLPYAAAISGSFWGEPEAGLIGNHVYARPDTPVHSLLHEACHLIVLPDDKRLQVHTNATNQADEEDAVCYLQLILADTLKGVGSQRIMQDMDRWGYNFRLGSAKAWFHHDAEDAQNWLIERGLEINSLAIANAVSANA